MAREFTCPDPVPLAEDDYCRAAAALGCEVAAIRAVIAVESRGGFLPDGRPRILFERHVFHRLTGGRFDGGHRQISARLPGGYRGGALEYARLEQALALERAAALRSTSWGAFQIMGFNHAPAGFAEVEEFVAAMVSGEAAQLDAFVAFLRHEGLARMLGERDWTGFARRYNGPGFRRNGYDERLASAYARFAESCGTALRMGDSGAEVRRLQLRLGIAADGLFGPATSQSLRRFQRRQGLVVDGIAGPRTWARLAGD